MSDAPFSAMSQSLAKIILHIVFSTKNRQPFIHDAIAKQLFEYLAKCCLKNKTIPLAVGGYQDHVHIALLMNKIQGIAFLIKSLKTDSSDWLKSQGPEFQQFYWQRGYGVFSVSESQQAKLVNYIGNQQNHHQTRNFMDEYRLFLTKHGITFDERYLWD